MTSEDLIFFLEHCTMPNVGKSDVEITNLGLGCASLGDLYVKIDSVQAIRTVEAAHSAGIKFFDTAPWYGLGLSESRVGLALSSFPRNTYVLSTKVGRFLHPHHDSSTWSDHGWAGGLQNSIEFAYGFDDVMRQHRESLLRLGVGRVDSLVIHDMDEAESQAPTHARGTREHLAGVEGPGGYAALETLRREGTIKCFGAGLNCSIGLGQHTMETYRRWNAEYVEFLLGLPAEGERPLDFLLLAGVYNLLDLSAWEDGILQRCVDSGVSVVVGGAFATGILATGVAPDAKYNYDEAPPAMVERVTAIEAVCRQFQVPLSAVALQFPLGHPAVISVIPGCKSPAEVDSSVATFGTPVPAGVWAALKERGLLPKDVPTPNHPP